MYKSRLTSSVIDTDGTPLPSQAQLKVTWSTASVREADERSGMTVDIEYPVFRDEDLATLNLLEHAWATTELMRYRLFAIRNEDAPAGYVPHLDEPADLPSYHEITASYDVLLLGPHAASLRYAIREFHSGAAHGSHYVRTVTAQRHPLVVLTFDALFRADIDHLSHVSSLVTAQLLDQGLEEWTVRDGVGPASANFGNFNITREGLLLTFPEYQVASYAQGPQYATLPWQSIHDYLNWDCRVFEDLEIR
jgi:hypothetical protein